MQCNAKKLLQSKPCSIMRKHPIMHSSKAAKSSSLVKKSTRYSLMPMPPTAGMKRPAGGGPLPSVWTRHRGVKQGQSQSLRQTAKKRAWPARPALPVQQPVCTCSSASARARAYTHSKVINSAAKQQKIVKQVRQANLHMKAFSSMLIHIYGTIVVDTQPADLDQIVDAAAAGVSQPCCSKAS